MPGKAPLRARLVLRDNLDWDALTAADVVALRAKVNRLRASRLARIVLGFPDRRTRIEEQSIDLPGRRLTLRVHRPRTAGSAKLPLILSLHGGGFIFGTPAQNDWLNSRLAAHLPAIVVSLAYRLAPEHPMPAQVDDAFETLVRLVGDPFGWGVDPASVAVFGESAGGTIAALVALRARKEGLTLRAQALAYPGTDWSETRADYPSEVANGGNPGLSQEEWRTAHRLSVPATVDPRDVSPIMAENLADLPPTLIVVGELDAALDQGWAYAHRLRADGSEAKVTVYPRAVHGFISTPGLVSAARPARREIVTFLGQRLR